MSCHNFLNFLGIIFCKLCWNSYITFLFFADKLTPSQKHDFIVVDEMKVFAGRWKTFCCFCWAFLFCLHIHDGFYWIHIHPMRRRFAISNQCIKIEWTLHTASAVRQGEKCQSKSNKVRMKFEMTLSTLEESDQHLLSAILQDPTLQHAESEKSTCQISFSQEMCLISPVLRYPPFSQTNKATLRDYMAPSKIHYVLMKAEKEKIADEYGIWLRTKECQARRH